MDRCGHPQMPSGHCWMLQNFPICILAIEQAVSELNPITPNFIGDHVGRWPSIDPANIAPVSMDVLVRDLRYAAGVERAHFGNTGTDAFGTRVGLARLGSDRGPVNKRIPHRPP